MSGLTQLREMCDMPILIRCGNVTDIHRNSSPDSALCKLYRACHLPCIDRHAVQWQIRVV